MHKKAFIVVGLGYGDEGKGLATDFLCNQSKQSLVIRYNGGHQAGHTVCTTDGIRHVFSSFGAGTLRNIPTYWSRYCTFSPAYMLYELDSLPVSPTLYVDWFCPVTTHYDVLYNRHLEAAKGAQKLGSCGVGFGATIDRHFFAGIKLYAGELSKLNVYKEKLKEIRAYYQSKFERDIGFYFNSFNHENEDEKFRRLIDEVHDLQRNKILSFTTEEKIFTQPDWEKYILEGAQGILLDKKFGNQPYITKSNTTSQNALELLKKNVILNHSEVSIYYVTRAYLTRHGEGPFKEMPSNYHLKNIEAETNVLNEHQGKFKTGLLDLALLDYALACDNNFSVGLEKNLLITCLDQLNDENISYHFKDTLKKELYRKFPKRLNCDFRNTLFSFHPYSEALDF